MARKPKYGLRKSLESKRSTYDHEFRARQSCENPCRTYFNKLEAAVDRGNTKVAEFHASRYWSCVWSCMDTRVPKKLKRTRIAAKIKKRRR